MAEEPRGFIYSIQDVKTLILFVLARVDQAVSMTTLYELCFQDDRFSYFDMAIAVPQLVASGHVVEEDDTYTISELGRTDGTLLETDLALSLRTHCLNAIAQYRAGLRRAEHFHCQIEEREDHLFNVIMTQKSIMGQLLKIELMAPNLNQARVVERAWNQHPEAVLKSLMSALTD